MKKKLFFAALFIVFGFLLGYLPTHARPTTNIETVILPDETVAIEVGSTILQSLYPKEAYPDLYCKEFTWECLYNNDNNTWIVFQFDETMGYSLEIHLKKSTAEVVFVGIMA
ncbi:MAG: hypothetical protein IJC88_05380 [Oscillospiraceae bacterium]|nr:hypothetical protein [Oscillospiraceae bacterium]